MSSSYVLDAVRSPFGRYGGALAGVRPDDLGAHVVRALLDRAPQLDPGAIDDVLFGNANGAGEDNRNVARMAALLAGLPTSVTGSSINRLCGSSLDAAMQASRMVEVGDASTVLVGGVESMSRAPWILLKPEKGFPRGHETLHSSTLGWRMVNPEMPEEWTISLGASAEKLAGMYSISREDQDAFAVRSHRLAAQAWEGGFYDAWVVPVPDTELERDENIRPDSSPEKLAKLRPAFAKDGTVTAGNSSALNDGAAAGLIGGERAAGAIGARPPGRIAGRARGGGAGRGAAGADRRAGGARRRPRRLRDRARRGGQQGAGAGGDRLGRRRRRRAQRGVRLAVAGLRARLARARPREGQPQRRGPRPPPSPPRPRRAGPPHPPPPAAPPPPRPGRG